MTAPIAGIDPHQAQFTVGIVDANGVEVVHDSFPQHRPRVHRRDRTCWSHAVSPRSALRARRVGARTSRSPSWRPGSTPARCPHSGQRSRRLAKTDAVDAVAAARALLAEPLVGAGADAGGLRSAGR